jgi:hypothetical protein
LPSCFAGDIEPRLASVEATRFGTVKEAPVTIDSDRPVSLEVIPSELLHALLSPRPPPGSLAIAQGRHHRRAQHSEPAGWLVLRQNAVCTKIPKADYEQWQDTCDVCIRLWGKRPSWRSVSLMCSCWGGLLFTRMGLQGRHVSNGWPSEDGRDALIHGDLRAHVGIWSRTQPLQNLRRL